MSTYESMRAFADSWVMLGMLAFFATAIAFALRPGGKKSAEEAAQIPLKED